MTKGQYKIKNDGVDKYPKTCNSLNSDTTFSSVFNKSKNTILSLFTSFLASTMPLTADLSDRTSLSILTIPNTYLAVDDHLSRHQLSSVTLADVLRYHQFSPVQPSCPPPLEQAHHHAPSNHYPRHHQLWLREPHSQLPIWRHLNPLPRTVLPVQHHHPLRHKEV